MCGRYRLDLNADLSFLAGAKEGEIFPTDRVTVLLAGTKAGSIAIDQLSWGFTSGSGKPLINARAETVLEKPTFCQPFRQSRCVFPTTGFYEWDRSNHKAKTLFNAQVGGALYLAGFYRDRECIILTRAASPSFATVHDRMPLILEANQIRAYLHEESFAVECLTQSTPELVIEKIEKHKSDEFALGL